MFHFLIRVAYRGVGGGGGGGAGEIHDGHGQMAEDRVRPHILILHNQALQLHPTRVSGLEADGSLQLFCVWPRKNGIMWALSTGRAGREISVHNTVSGFLSQG